MPTVYQANGRRAELLEKHLCASVTTPGSWPYKFSQTIYKYVSDWVKLISVEEKDYLSGDIISRVTNYSYPNSTDKLPREVSSVNSLGQTNKMKFKYPLDYTLPTSSSNVDLEGIRNLVVNHSNAAIIESWQDKVKTASTTVTLSGNINKYKVINGGNAVLYKTDKVETNAALASFQPSTTSSTAFIEDVNYKNETEVIAFTASNKPLEIISRNKISSFIYGQGEDLITCKADNAHYTDIAYTSFEDESNTGGWIYTIGGLQIIPYTGGIGYNLSQGSAVTRTIPNSYCDIAGGNNIIGTPCKYIVSYWKRGTNTNVSLTFGSVTYTPTLVGNSAVIGGNTWTYYEHIIDIGAGQTVSISGNAIVDELRLCPYNAQMETFTHKPLVGITTKTDVTGLPTFYEYDLLGRLKLIRDWQKNIIKKYEYGVNITE